MSKRKSAAEAGARRSGGEGWALVRECPRCGGTEGACRCTASRGAAGPAVFRLRMEKRRGKPVTVCAAEGLAGEELRALGKELKVLCGTGGTVKGQEVELQGDHRDRLRAHLADRGYRVKG